MFQAGTSELNSWSNQTWCWVKTECVHFFLSTLWILQTYGCKSLEPANRFKHSTLQESFLHKKAQCSQGSLYQPPFAQAEKNPNYTQSSTRAVRWFQGWARPIYAGFPKPVTRPHLLPHSSSSASIGSKSDFQQEKYRSVNELTLEHVPTSE